MHLSPPLRRDKVVAPTGPFGQLDAISLDAPDDAEMLQPGLEAAPCVFVLLSTYNGEAYLPAQLESLLAQTYTNWVLYWRDDGSTDATLTILAEFTATVGAGRCVQVREPEGRVFPAASYMAMVRAVLPAVRATDLVAFVDQDDVWLPAKLCRGALALAQETSEHPALYCARLAVVDADLHRLTETRISAPACGFPASLTQNIATGCTIMLNRSAAGLVARSVRPALSMHDWWCYLLVTAAGGRILVDSALVALYRQHRHNFIGIQRSRMRRAVAALRRGPAMYMNVLRQHLAALTDQPELMSEAARAIVDELQQALQGSLRQKLAVLRLRGLRRQNWSETILFRVWFLIG